MNILKKFNNNSFLNKNIGIKYKNKLFLLIDVVS